MLKLILLGLLSGLLFSSTFVLNELMSLQGGDWFWSAALRYFFMILFLSIVITINSGFKSIIAVAKLFVQHWGFWTLTGSIGFGAFYALICFSADYSPGWIIAATWQFTIVATLIVLRLFGRTFARKVWFFSAIIFLGVLLINLSHATEITIDQLLFGALPVFFAAFCYPFGNQLVWEVQHGKHSKLPNIKSPLLQNSLPKVLLMSLGSIPMWLILGIVRQPQWPETSQVINSALVAFLSGVCATTIFIYARSKANSASQLAGVDATQSSEVVFALLAGIFILNSAQINYLSIIGLVLIFIGLYFFVHYQHRN